MPSCEQEALSIKRPDREVEVLNAVARRLLDRKGQVEAEGQGAHRRNQHAVKLGYLSHVIAEHWKFRVQLLFPMSQRWREVRADCQNLYIHIIEFSDTRLVCSEFLRSTTGERRREECQDDVLFASEIGQLHVFSSGVL